MVEGLYNHVGIAKKKLLDRKELEKRVRFLVHFSQTFPTLFPYFKGISLNMESWRIGRSSNG